MHKMVENFIQLWDLLDFKPKKDRFTWTNNRLGSANISARLEYFLVQSSFLLEKKIISSSILPKLSLDHMPILLQLYDEEDLGPISFRFSPLWIVCEGFMNTVSKSWTIPVTWSSSYVWEQKLKNTKFALKEWVKHSITSPSSDRKEALNKLEVIQMDMEGK